MNKKILFFISVCTLMIISCNNKKLTEVVEVPLPSAEEKITVGMPDDVKADEGTFEMIKLPYSYEALAPNIDALTMEMHYSKHYLTYTNNLNKAIAGTESENLTIEEILKRLDTSNDDLRNNAGGYYNHSVFGKVWRQKQHHNLKTLWHQQLLEILGLLKSLNHSLKMLQLNNLDQDGRG
ncbi:superoxide dismutase [Flavobacterium myungsuense]|uniref:superoxide dismutase n=1 Tax=Flavobacterium myungsuense TaxID=651823 RepID=UPI00363177CC